MGNCFKLPKSNRELLESNSYSNLELFSYAENIVEAKVVKIYDGDTITIVFYPNENKNPHKYNFRLYGIDCHEMKPLKTQKDRNEEIKLAKQEKAYLEKLILNKVVWIRFCKAEKFGRQMGLIYFDSLTKEEVEKDEINLKGENRLKNSKSINQMMIQNGYAKPYYGGKKGE